jgi:UrcA family protein
MMRRTIVAILALIGTISPALAQPAEGDITVQRTMTVRYGDLNLNDQRDVAILLERIGRAAEQACGGRPNSLYELDDTHLRQEYRRCHDDAVTRAVTKLHAPLVTQRLALAE